MSDMDKKEMIFKASLKFKEFMEILKIDCDKDPNSIDTPMRVAKMYVNELFNGRYSDYPAVKSFPNTQEYDEIIFTNCEVIGVCAHHWATIAYKIYIGVLSNPDPKSRLIGLSKYTRIAEWICARPSIQEESTSQLHAEIDKLCDDNKGVMIYIVGQHGCCMTRGVKQLNGRMITSKCSGAFLNCDGTRNEFFQMVGKV